ncbi:unnamed protein product [Cyprideis torosa]|uniref:Uncharacterized protein n=1 Tax=Cyprideis torosa TaxID=163714 RepID=A0A7R8WK49_9CRUS|nr:unnamed protein product [Cyprideis torosa]CAG0900026.1 unnamed protein product [Cyprideis torosa]
MRARKQRPLSQQKWKKNLSHQELRKELKSQPRKPLGKPMKKKHRKIRDVHDLERSWEISSVPSASAPTKGSEEKLPRSIRDIQRFQEWEKNRQKNTKKKKQIGVVDKMDPLQKGMTRPLKPIPVFEQRSGETNQRFKTRVHFMTNINPSIPISHPFRSPQAFLAQADYERKYDVDLWTDVDTGHVDMTKRPTTDAEEVNAEIATMMSIPGRPALGGKLRKELKETEKKQKKKRDVNAPQGKDGKRKRMERVQGRKKRRLAALSAQEEEDQVLNRREDVPFGEVVHAPPQLPKSKLRGLPATELANRKVRRHTGMSR